MLGHGTSVCYSHGKNPRSTRPKPRGHVPQPQPAPLVPPPRVGVTPNPMPGPQPLLQPNGLGPRRQRRRPVHRAPPQKDPLGSNMFGVLS